METHADVMTTRQLADLLKVSVETVTRWGRSGKYGPSEGWFKVGREFRITWRQFRTCIAPGIEWGDDSRNEPDGMMTLAELAESMGTDIDNVARWAADGMPHQDGNVDLCGFREWLAHEGALCAAALLNIEAEKVVEMLE